MTEANWKPASQCETRLRNEHPYLPKDFVRTAGGLAFAVVAGGPDPGLAARYGQRTIVSLRYVRFEKGWKKLSTQQALSLLRHRHPDWLLHCPSRDVLVQAVPESVIAEHLMPSACLQKIRHAETPLLDSADLPSATKPANPPSEGTLSKLDNILGDELLTHVGVTGSYLLQAEGPESDIDLVVYGRANFDAVRNCFHQSATAKDESSAVRELREEDWAIAFSRRGGELLFEEYVAYERRKRNKYLLAEPLWNAPSGKFRRVDLSCLDHVDPIAHLPGRKLRIAECRAIVTDASAAYLSPAIYRVRHALVEAVVVHTPTYAGQACAGEVLAARGWLEQLDDGRHRLVVGTSREADGQVLRVLQIAANKA